MRSSQSAGTSLSASVVAYQVRAGSTSAHSVRAYSKPAALAAPTLPASTVTKCDVGAELADQAVASVVGGVEHDHRQHGNRHAQRGGRRLPADIAADAPTRCGPAPRRRPSPVPCLLDSRKSGVSTSATQTKTISPTAICRATTSGAKRGGPSPSLQLARKALAAPRTSPPRHALSAAPAARCPTARRDRREGPSATSRSDTRGTPTGRFSTRPRRPCRSPRGRDDRRLATSRHTRSPVDDSARIASNSTCSRSSLAVTSPSGMPRKIGRARPKPGRRGNEFFATRIGQLAFDRLPLPDTPPHRRSPPPPAPRPRARRAPTRWHRGRASRRPGEPQPGAAQGSARCSAARTVGPIGSTSRRGCRPRRAVARRSVHSC